MGSKKHLCQEKGIIISKVKIILIIINMPFDTENTKPKRELQYETFFYLTEIHYYISDIPFVHNKDFNIEKLF